MSEEIRKPWIVLHVEDKNTCHLLASVTTESRAIRVMQEFIEKGEFKGYLTYAKIVIKYHPKRISTSTYDGHCI